MSVNLPVFSESGFSTRKVMVIVPRISEINAPVTGLRPDRIEYSIVTFEVLCSLARNFMVDGTIVMAP